MFKQLTTRWASKPVRFVSAVALIASTMVTMASPAVVAQDVGALAGSTFTVKTGAASLAQLVVTFNEFVYTNADGTGGLETGDFTFTDASGGGVTITGMDDADGSDGEVTLSLSGNAQVGADTLRPAGATSIFNASGEPAPVITNTVTDGTSPTFTAATAASTTVQFVLTFDEAVYTNSDGTGALVAADFSLDANGMTITAVSHTAGATSATFTASGTVLQGNERIQANDSSVYDAAGNAMATDWENFTNGTLPTFTAKTGPASLAEFIMTFSEGVYTNNNATGVLVAADFSLDANGVTITAVSHTAGASSATFTASDSVWQGNQRIQANASSVYDVAGNAMATDWVTFTDGTAPAFSAATGATLASIVLTFFDTGTPASTEAVYTTTGATGSLTTSDFTVSDGLTVTALSDADGSDTNATLTLSGNATPGTTTIAAASATSVYDAADNAMGTTAVTIFDGTIPAISSVTTTASALNTLTVTFSEGVYTTASATGALQAADFDTPAGVQVVLLVTHTAGSATATLTLDNPNEACCA